MLTTQKNSQIKQKQSKERKIYLSISCEGNSVVGATGHFCHSLAEEISGHQGRGQPVVGGAISELAVAIVAPGIHFSIYTATSASLLMLSQKLIFY